MRDGELTYAQQIEMMGHLNAWKARALAAEAVLNAARAEARPAVDREAVAGPAYTSVGYQYRFSDPMSGHPVWRTSSSQWNGQRPQETREIFALLSPATSPLQEEVRPRFSEREWPDLIAAEFAKPQFMTTVADGGHYELRFSFSGPEARERCHALEDAFRAAGRSINGSAQ